MSDSPHSKSQALGDIPTGQGGNSVNPAQWDDLQETGLGTRLDSAAGKLGYNLALKGIDFDDDTDITVDADKIHFGYQYFHRFKLDGGFRPHLHWIQAQAAVPNWWMRYAVWKNGAVVGSWTSLAALTHAFTWTAGSIMQISSFPAVDLTSLGLDVSDFIDVEFTRDAANASALFAGVDPVAGAVTVRAFDPHVQIDSAGSRQEYIK
jgi:hypothetical protein